MLPKTAAREKENSTTNESASSGASREGRLHESRVVPTDAAAGRASSVPASVPAHEARHGARLVIVEDDPTDTRRETGAEFVRGTTFGWGKRELAAWLVKHYARATMSVADIELLAPDRDRPPTSGPISRPPSEGTSLDEQRVEEVILEARTRILRLLLELGTASTEGPSVRDMIVRGVVFPLPDGDGSASWVAVALPNLHLHDRVASLFVADCLNDPDDYRGIAFCRECGELSFAGGTTHAPGCESADLDDDG